MYTLRAVDEWAVVGAAFAHIFVCCAWWKLCLVYPRLGSRGCVLCVCAVHRCVLCADSAYRLVLCMCTLLTVLVLCDVLFKDVHCAVRFVLVCECVPWAVEHPLFWSVELRLLSDSLLTE